MLTNFLNFFYSYSSFILVLLFFSFFNNSLFLFLSYWSFYYFFISFFIFYFLIFFFYNFIFSFYHYYIMLTSFLNFFYPYVPFRLNKLIARFSYSSSSSSSPSSSSSTTFSSDLEHHLIWKLIHPRKTDSPLPMCLIQVYGIYINKGEVPKELIAQGEVKFRMVGVPFFDRHLLEDGVDFAKLVPDLYSLEILNDLNINKSDFETPIYGTDFPPSSVTDRPDLIPYFTHRNNHILYSKYFPSHFCLPDTPLYFDRSSLSFITYKESLRINSPSTWVSPWVGESLVYFVVARKLLHARGFQDYNIYKLFHILIINLFYLQRFHLKKSTPSCVLIELLAVAHSIHLTIDPLTGLITHISFNSVFHHYFLEKYLNRLKGSIPSEETIYSQYILRELVYLSRVDSKVFPYVKYFPRSS